MSDEEPTVGAQEGSTEPLPAPPDTLGDGRYELGALLGAGGMGIVRRATDTLLHREVAVKLLADSLAADPEARQRFLHEGRAVAKVGNPHVVAVHDVGEDGGRPYLVLELVNGPSLGDELRRDGPLQADDVAAIAAQALAGLSAAHAAGVLHRDIKPGNLLRTPDGDIKVVDFGVAQAADTPGLTRTGFIVGTGSYLAPERRRGAPASVATDLYALGATLVELLTGAPPSREAGTSPTSGLASTVPDHLRASIERLLAASPNDRPASAEDALITLVEGHPGAAPTPGGGGTVGGTVGDHVVDTEPEPTTAPARAAPRGTSASGRGGSSRFVEGGRSSRFLERGWRVVLLVGLTLFAIGILLRLSAGDDPTPSPPEEPATDEATPGLTDEARDLARWLRERADE